MCQLKPGKYGKVWEMATVLLIKWLISWIHCKNWWYFVGHTKRQWCTTHHLNRMVPFFILNLNTSFTLFYLKLESHMWMSVQNFLIVLIYFNSAKWFPSHHACVQVITLLWHVNIHLQWHVCYISSIYCHRNIVMQALSSPLPNCL